jgi:hypothetical protein
MMMTAAKDSFMARATRTTAVVVLALTFLESRTVLADSLSEMISPVSLPTINEDPRVDTEIRPLFLYTDISNDFVTNGGNYSVVAIQARLAITERFGLIATKDGYIFLRPKNVVPDNDGFANLAFGIKGALLRDAASGSILSAGFRYEAPSGEQDVLQGRGDGLVNPFVSAAKRFGNFTLEGYTGPRLALSGSDSSFYDLAVHADYKVDRFYPLVEFNWVHVLSGGERLPIDQEGFDLVDIGSQNAGGEDVATCAFGFRYRLLDSVDIGVVGELPLNDSIFGWRVTTDLIWRVF